MTTLIMALATGLYTGYLPKAPGTWGSLVALPLHLMLIRLEPLAYGLSLAGFILLAIMIAGSAEKICDRKDPGIIVIDEIAGMLIALIAAPPDFRGWLLAFLLFRLFDILKPFPIGWIDRRVQGGVGIVLDDLMAGLYTLIIIQVLKLLIW